MRILLFAPNGGASLSTGGGVGSALRQATLLAEIGHEVTVAGFQAYDLGTLAAIHDVGLSDGLRLARGTGGDLPRLARGVGVKLSPYNALLSPGFARWARRTIASSGAELLWFHDDIPRCVEAELGGRRTFVYVHYPLAGRSPAFLPPIDSARSLTERVNEALLRRVRVVSERVGELSEVTWTNSSVTRSVVARLWEGSRPSVVPLTYVEAPRALSARERVVVGIGTFTVSKGYEALLEGFRRSPLSGWTLALLGHARDPHYLSRLRALARPGRFPAKRVVLLPDAPRPLLEAWLGRASLIVHPAAVEPFGFSLLEGMSAGLAAIARRSEWSGAWTDLLERGRFGLGFDGPDDLAEALAVASGEPEWGRRALERSRHYSRGAVRAALEGACAS